MSSIGDNLERRLAFDEFEARLDDLLDRFEGRQISDAEFVEIIEEAHAAVDPDLPSVTLPLMVARFRRSLTKETDRGCALAVSAYLDEEMRRLIEAYLLKDEHLTGELFGSRGPLGTFAARIDVAFGLGLIGPKLRSDLHLIRKVRNEFAHTAGQVSFTDDSIASRCSELYLDLMQEALPPRRKFIRVTMGCLAMIHRKLDSVQHRSSPGDPNLESRISKREAAKVQEMVAIIMNRLGRDMD